MVTSNLSVRFEEHPVNDSIILANRVDVSMSIHLSLLYKYLLYGLCCHKVELTDQLLFLEKCVNCVTNVDGILTIRCFCFIFTKESIEKLEEKS